MSTLLSASLLNRAPRGLTLLHRLPATPLLSLILSLNLVVVAQLKHACSNGDLPAHDDTLSHTLHVVLLALDRRVVQVIRGHFE